MLDAFATSMIEMAGMMAAIYAVQVLLRMREEEARGRLEPVLAAAVTRPRWVAGYLLNAGLGAVVLLLVFAAAMALTAGLALGDTSGLLGEMIGAALAQLPAVLVIAAAVVAVFALLPRRAVVGVVAAARRVDPAEPRVRPQPRAAAVGAGPLAVHAPEGAGGRGRHRGGRRPCSPSPRRSSRRASPRSAAATSPPAEVADEDGAQSVRKETGCAPTRLTAMACPRRRSRRLVRARPGLPRTPGR